MEEGKKVAGEVVGQTEGALGRPDATFLGRLRAQAGPDW
jgi:hypothetical protein